jgi:hypothetical protein
MSRAGGNPPTTIRRRWSRPAPPLKLDAKVDVTFDVVVGKAGMRVS